MTVFGVDMRAVKFDVLWEVVLRRPHVSEAVLDVVKEALRHRWVFVEIHQVRSLAREGEYEVRWL